jgi:hypothetical protein
MENSMNSLIKILIIIVTITTILSTVIINCGPCSGTYLEEYKVKLPLDSLKNYEVLQIKRNKIVKDHLIRFLVIKIPEGYVYMFNRGRTAVFVPLEKE